MEPFLKWAGGKRWLTRSVEFIAPAKYTRYIEPFLGGGSIFFFLAPDEGVINDRNKDLMNLYRVLRDHPLGMQEMIQWHQSKHSDEHYYRVRAENPQDKLERAARFLYLNRACWNGLYRVNRFGQFNVPKGTKSKVFFESDNFLEASKLLKKMKLRSTDFEKIVDGALNEDFVFIDPPYTVKHNLNGFVRYNERMFSWEDQVRLAASVRRAVARGCKVAVTNADHESIRDLYDFADYRPLSRASVIAGSAVKRVITTEALFIANY
jgi:DNA adenine methylase